MSPPETDTASRLPGQIHPTAQQAKRDAAARRDQSADRINVGTLERVGSGVVGTTLTLLGLLMLVRRGSFLGGTSLAATGVGLAYRGATGHCAGYEAVGVTHKDASLTSHPLGRSIEVSRRTRINRPVDELYAYWRDLGNLPRIMRHVQRIDTLDDGRSHWVVTGPRGTVEWDAQITDDRPNELIAWRADPNADVPNHGYVRFQSSEANDHGSIVEVSFSYHPPAGVVGAAFAYALGEAPSQQLHEDLRRFKQLMEAGEIATNHGQPRGRC
ncbi:SRPBCC family protein [Phycisphaerales bacterium AB-hyl4]|uniref:SRPBCC family protein n=1 Tax=Natronomicrosphaera hydrolytica TaxID=3242702 RepID=A0ABV4U6S1_9BACT